ncbi:type I-E CRISPR-associated protein Cas5/CasD [Kitasatospora sp. NPDC059795]|uniref:type I-E CRISPR-associated protein Cas5/CasD n=1 Tax=Kitasatospora sp. NPDC059795 TaxID=3346949 RepID=UPI003668DE28
MTGGLLLHLSGPLQSWGGAQVRNVYPTHRHPTRSALVGLLAASLGREPDADNSEDLGRLRFTIRIDRPGRNETDFHTVGGGYPPEKTPPTARGKHKTKGGTLLTYRDYLADAAFTVAVTGQRSTLAGLARALEHPVYPSYLGRSSCPPDVPLLAWADADPARELRCFPLHRDAGGPVEFVYEEAPEARAPADETLRQDYRGRQRFADYPLWYRWLDLPDAPDGGLGTDYLTALTDYRKTRP